MNQKKIVVRFAPSPTGMLHIGSARTALFNYLFAKNQQGKFLLRIEDTDKERSTEEAKQEIIKSLDWLGLAFDDEIIYQSQRETRHREIAYKLLELGQAYYCYASKAELELMREEAMKNKRQFSYNRLWRDRSVLEAPKNVNPVIRFKAPLSGETVLIDQIQGRIAVKNETQEDFILLRSDLSPTYMLAVVADDHDMEVTHVIRGDDHLPNSAKQILIYKALGWEVPLFAHIPLIYGIDGKKLSKRHGATAVSEYQALGYLPEAIRNYLLRLGFSHGDDEIISDQQAIEWFNLESLGKSPARFDFKKLDSVNSHYLRQTPDETLIKFVSEKLGWSPQHSLMSEAKQEEEIPQRLLQNHPHPTSPVKGEEKKESLQHSLMSEAKQEEESPQHSLMSEAKQEEESPQHSLMSEAKQEEESPQHSLMSEANRQGTETPHKTSVVKEEGQENAGNHNVVIVRSETTWQSSQIKYTTSTSSYSPLKAIAALMPELKIRVTNLNQLIAASAFLAQDFIASDHLTNEAKKSLENLKNHQEKILKFYTDIKDFSHQFLYEASQDLAIDLGIKMKDLAGFLRALVTGSHISPSIFEVMEIMGKEEVISRLSNVSQSHYAQAKV